MEITELILSALATLDPPNFITIIKNPYTLELKSQYEIKNRNRQESAIVCKKKALLMIAGLFHIVERHHHYTK
jgi:hypothetical protein